MEEMILARRRMLMNRSLAPIPASNITHYWKLNGNSLDSISDAHGSNTNITFTSTGALVGQSAVFGGTPSVINFGDRNSFSFTDGINDLPFSMSIWLNFDYIPVGTDYFNPLSKQSSSTVKEYDLQFHPGESRLWWRLSSNGSGNNLMNNRDDVGIVAGIWNNYIITYDGSKTVAGFKFFKNGVLKNNKTTSGTYVGMSNTTAPLRLGVVNANAFNFKGKICQFAIFNKALSPNEVNSVYQKGKNGQNLI